jgi:hypothetical protein
MRGVQGTSFCRLAFVRVRAAIRRRRLLDIPIRGPVLLFERAVVAEIRSWPRLKTIALTGSCSGASVLNEATLAR